MGVARSSLLIFLVTGSVIYGQSTPRESLLVLSKNDHTLAIVDPSSLKVLARVPVGNDPHEVIASADGKLAYVSNYGFGAFNTLAVVDLVGQKALTAVDLGPLRGPHGLVVAGGKTWFTAEGAKAIGSYDPTKKQVDWVMGTGQNRTHMIFVSPDLQHIYTTNVSSATVSIIEKDNRPRGPLGPPPGFGEAGSGRARSGPAGSGSGLGGPPPGMRNGPNGPGSRRGPFGPPGGEWDETVIAVGRGSEGFDVSPDGKELWVANAQDGTASIVDIAAKRVAETLQTNMQGANRLKFTPDGKHVFISGPGIAVIDAQSHKELKRLDLGHGAAGIQMQPDGSHAYVACNNAGYVAVIDLKTLEVTGKIDAGQQPDGLAWATQR